MKRGSTASNLLKVAQLFTQKADIAEKFEKIDLDRTELLAKIEQDRANYLAEMTSIDSQISELNGTPTTTAASTPTKHRGRPKGSKNKAKTETKIVKAKKSAKAKTEGRERVRAVNEKTLAETISDVLKKNPEGLRVAGIVDGVLKEGYKSNTKGEFGSIVYQALYKMMGTKAVKRDGKAYKLAA